MFSRIYLDHWLSGRAACCIGRHDRAPCLNCKSLPDDDTVDVVCVSLHNSCTSTKRTCKQNVFANTRQSILSQSIWLVTWFIAVVVVAYRPSDSNISLLYAHLTDDLLQLRVLTANWVHLTLRFFQLHADTFTYEPTAKNVHENNNKLFNARQRSIEMRQPQLIVHNQFRNYKLIHHSSPRKYVAILHPCL